MGRIGRLVGVGRRRSGGAADELESNRSESKQADDALSFPGHGGDPGCCFLGSKRCFLGSREKHNARGAISGSFVSWSPFFDMYELVWSPRNNFSIFCRTSRPICFLTFGRASHRSPRNRSAFLGVGHVCMSSMSRPWSVCPSSIVRAPRSRAALPVPLHLEECM